MSLTHDEQSLAAPYVLGALDDLERRAFEAHLETCAACTEDVRALRPVAHALAHAAPQRTPRPDLRDRVLAAVTGTAKTSAGARSQTGSWLPAAAAVLLAAGLGAYAWHLHGRVSGLEARLGDAERRAAGAEQEVERARHAADQAQVAMAILAAPDVAQIDLAGQPAAPRATARALWSRTQGMVFTATSLPPPPPDRVYQVWVVTAEAPVSAGVIAPDASGSASAVFRTPADIGAPLAVAVTLEPAPGVPAPTGERYLVGTPAGRAM
ncbi:MAG TPA: anti-sigma factor [Vicinamibacterales bacterium]|nr:anti-sigma factor [Vicinamibacterales bacterium]